MPETEKNITLKQLYDEIVKNRTEIKSIIQATEVKLQLKIEGLEDTVTKLKEENQELRSEIEEIRRNEKKDSIITFNLYKRSESFSCSQLCRKLNDLISTSLVETDIKNFYFLGKAESSPLKIEFTRFLAKLDVLANKKKLKGVNISIVNDLTEQQRKEHKLLRKYLLNAKENKQNCYIKNDKLYIEDKSYTVSDLQEREDQEEDQDSTPSTPTSPKRVENCEVYTLTQQENQSLEGRGATRKMFTKRADKPITRAQEKKIHNK